MIKQLVKKAFWRVGLKMEWRDRLAEQIPATRCDYVPHLRRNGFGQIIHKGRMCERVKDIEGDFVECGVAAGFGLLVFMLHDDLLGVNRNYWGFDSFEGFPPPTGKDRGTHVTAGDWSTSPELVQRVLTEGRLPREMIGRVRLVRGFFADTLDQYDGRIALLHLDCDLHDSYMTCLRQLYNKVIPGGIIMFDDYGDANFPGASKAVDAFFADKPEKPIQEPGGGWHLVKQGAASSRAA